MRQLRHMEVLEAMHLQQLEAALQAVQVWLSLVPLLFSARMLPMGQVMQLELVLQERSGTQVAPDRV